MLAAQNLHQGFTLKELVAVIAILIVCFMIFCPTYVEPIGKRRQMACVSNEKQLGLAFLQYAQDNDGHWPTGISTLNPSLHIRPGVGWAGQVWPYVKSLNIYKCPEDKTQNHGASFVCSYGYNSNLAALPKAPLGRLAALSAPNVTVMLFEVSGSTADIEAPDEGAAEGMTTFSAVGNGTNMSLRCGPLGVTCQAKYATGFLGGRTPPAPPGQYTGIAGRHAVGPDKDGSSFLLADGHVKWLPPDKVSSGANALKPTAAQTGTTLGRAAGVGDGFYGATFSIR